ncbi:TFIID-31kDa-domain-containing protein [Peniophora sp. CONT]|nr:TFIID-31kDa-domain-containing protein [Peniophora sp. CONT]
MSRATNAAGEIPPSARDISLILASTPGVSDAQPAVLTQLLEFAHRYTAQVLQDGLVYAEHAGHNNKLELDDVILAVQARVGWELGGRVPKEYIMSLATQTNSQPLPAVPEAFGVRLPPESDRLTSVDFNLVPNKPPPTIQQYDEEIEEIEEEPSDEDEDEDMEPATLPPAMPPQTHHHQPAPPVAPMYAPSDVDMIGVEDAVAPNENEEGSDDDDALFGGGDDDDEGMEEVAPAADAQANGVKRKLVEDDDYD